VEDDDEMGEASSLPRRGKPRKASAPAATFPRGRPPPAPRVRERGPAERSRSVSPSGVPEVLRCLRRPFSRLGGATGEVLEHQHGEVPGEE